MNRRSQLLWAATGAAILVNGFILWKRSRTPLLPQPGSEQVQVDRVLEWEALPVVALNQSLENVKVVIANYPRNDCPNIPERSQVSLDKLSESQKDDLFLAMASLLQCYEKSSPDELVSYMAARNERFNTDIMNRIKEEKVRQGYITLAEVKSVTEADFFTKIWGWKKCNSFWDSVVEKAGHVCLWRCQDLADASKHPLAETADRKLFRNVTNYAHLFAPELSFREACKQPNGVLIADIGVVVRHNSAMRLERSPYYFRFWFSERDHLWHPQSLAQVRTSYEAAGPAVTLLF